MEVSKWIGKAQRFAQERASQLFKTWLETPEGQNWRQKWERKPPKLNKRVHPTVAQNSPYAHGFSLPDWHHDLIKAIGKGDEVTAKYIMLNH